MGTITGNENGKEQRSGRSSNRDYNRLNTIKMTSCVYCGTYRMVRPLLFVSFNSLCLSRDGNGM